MFKKLFLSARQGFTLIELLVVVAIIGLLATFVQTRFAAATAKARDADRLNDLKNISSVLNMISMDTPSSFFIAPCNLEDASTLTCIGAGQPGNVEEKFIRYIDPYFTTAALANASPCEGNDTSPCQYSIQSAGASVSDVVIQFYLEYEAAGLAAGAHTMTSEGSFN